RLRGQRLGGSHGHRHSLCWAKSSLLMTAFTRSRSSPVRKALTRVLALGNLSSGRAASRACHEEADPQERPGSLAPGAFRPNVGDRGAAHRSCGKRGIVTVSILMKFGSGRFTGDCLAPGSCEPIRVLGACFPNGLGSIVSQVLIHPVIASVSPHWHIFG